jgi:prevent-host-death family protein
METATIADLRNNFRRVSAWIDDGKPVEITRHGRPFARLVPSGELKKTKVAWPDFSAQRRAIWGERVFSEKQVAEMKAFEMEGQEG